MVEPETTYDKKYKKKIDAMIIEEQAIHERKQ